MYPFLETFLPMFKDLEMNLEEYRLRFPKMGPVVEGFGAVSGE